MMDKEYLKEKRTKVLKEIKPICEAFKITDYDYIIDDGRETLRIYDTFIACSLNSISAIVDELIGWIFINTWCERRSLGSFTTQTKNVIQSHWA